MGGVVKPFARLKGLAKNRNNCRFFKQAQGRHGASCKAMAPHDDLWSCDPDAAVFTAQYAIGFPVAAALLRGRVGVAEISAPAFSDTELCALTARLSFREDDAFNARFPAERWARLTVRLRNGAVLTTPDTQAKGDPKTPYSDAEMIAKFHDLAG